MENSLIDILIAFVGIILAIMMLGMITLLIEYIIGNKEKAIEEAYKISIFFAGFLFIVLIIIILITFITI